MSRDQAMKVLWENVEKGAISGEIVAELLGWVHEAYHFAARK